MEAEQDLVVLGRFGKKHGVKGFITVHSYTEPRENLLEYAKWQVYIERQWQVLKILKVELRDKQILAQIENFDTREQVGRLTNLDIYVSKELMPALPEGEFYWHELIGMEVIDESGKALGRIVEIFPTGSNDVLVIKTEDNKQALMPYLPGNTILNIDIVQGKMLVAWDWDY